MSFSPACLVSPLVPGPPSSNLAWNQNITYEQVGDLCHLCPKWERIGWTSVNDNGICVNGNNLCPKMTEPLCPSAICCTRRRNFCLGWMKIPICSRRRLEQWSSPHQTLAYIRRPKVELPIANMLHSVGDQSQCHRLHTTSLKSQRWPHLCSLCHVMSRVCLCSIFVSDANTLLPRPSPGKPPLGRTPDCQTRKG